MGLLVSLQSELQFHCAIALNFIDSKIFIKGKIVLKISKRKPFSLYIYKMKNLLIKPLSSFI